MTCEKAFAYSKSIFPDFVFPRLHINHHLLADVFWRLDAERGRILRHSYHSVPRSHDFITGLILGCGIISFPYCADAELTNFHCEFGLAVVLRIARTYQRALMVTRWSGPQVLKEFIRRKFLAKLRQIRSNYGDALALFPEYILRPSRYRRIGKRAAIRRLCKASFQEGNLRTSINSPAVTGIILCFSRCGAGSGQAGISSTKRSNGISRPA